MSESERIESPWRPGDILLALLPLGLLQIRGLEPRVSLGLLVFVLGWMIVFPWWSWRRRGGRPPPAMSIGGVARELLIAPLFLLLLVLVTILARLVVNAFYANPPKAPHTLKAAFDAFEGVRFAVFIMALCCLGPVAEEVFFRWFLFRGLRKWWGGRAAALTQAAIFALYHLPYADVRRLAIHFVVGLLFQRIYLWRGTLLAPVLVHALGNVLALVGALYLE